MGIADISDLAVIADFADFADIPPGRRLRVPRRVRKCPKRPNKDGLLLTHIVQEWVLV